MILLKVVSPHCGETRSAGVQRTALPFSVVPANSWLYDANGLAKPQRMAAIWPWLLGFSVTVFSHTLRSGPTNGGPGMLKNWQLVQAKPAPPINSWPGKHRRGMTERPVDTSPNGYIR